VLSLIASLLRLVSVVICLIVVASFVIFVVEQTSSASTHQQEELGVHTTPANAPTNTGTPAPTTKHQSTLHKKIDEASNELTSPFSSITSGSSSQWLIRGVNLLLTLLLYGFLLGFLARAIRVRA